MPSASDLVHLLTLVARQDPATPDGSSDPAPATGDAGGDAVDVCAASNYGDRWGLRIGAIFVILVTSLLGTLTPILLRSIKVIPRSVWEFAKFFGSGVIIATAFIHLLAPAWDALSSDCLVQNYPVFGIYDWAPAIALMATFVVLILETVAYRVGMSKLAKLGVHLLERQDEQAHPLHTHSHSETGAAGAVSSSTDSASPSNEVSAYPSEKKAVSQDDTEEQIATTGDAVKQLVGVAVLEFGVVLHSVIIGLTLAVNENFVILFVVIIFHQMFEGLGLGSRLASLRLPRHLQWARYAAAGLYCICTPIGMAAGLGAISSFNGNAAQTNLVTGVLDAFSAGILLYTGFVELIAHEILFNPALIQAKTGKLVYVYGCMMLGAGLMALLGRWA